MGILEASPRRAGPRSAVRKRMDSLTQRFRADAVDGFAATFALTVDQAPFEVTIGRGRCLVREGQPRSPTTWIQTDAETWAELDDGSLTSIEAFLDGRVSVRGNVEHAVRLQSLFTPSARERVPSDLDHVDIDAGRHRLSAYVLGDGPTVVLLHGLGASKVSWLPLLGPLAERYRVVVPDLPGHGESSKPRANYTPLFFSAVVRELLDAIGAGEATLIGNSMGGRVALEVAARAPRRVRAMVLLDPALPGLPYPYYAKFLRVFPIELAAIPLPVRRRVVMNGIRQLFGDPSRLPQAAYQAGADEFIRLYRSGRARVALLASLRGLMRDRPEPFWERVRGLEIPALVLWGLRDRLVPARFGERLAREMPRARLVRLPGVGHVPQFEVPERTRDETLRFLETLSARGVARGRG